MSIPVAINRLAAFLVPNASPEGQTAMAAVMKLVARGAINGGWPTAREAALVLTPAEQSVLFKGGRRFLVSLGSRVVLVGAVLAFVRRVLGGGEENTLESRLEIITAHVLKGGPLLTRALGVSEQVLFIVTDALGEALADAAAGIFSTSDAPGLSTGFPLHPGFGNYYAELLPPVENIDAVDSIIEAPSLLLQPVLLPLPDPPAIPPPGPPMPSFGRRR